MPIYHKLGAFPPKRHTQFRKPDGGLYYEQLFGTEGFVGMASLLYHVHRPTQIRSVGEALNMKPEVVVDKNIIPRRLLGFRTQPADDFLQARRYQLVNSDCYIALAAPRKSMTDYFYKNADADELIFVHKGSGTLKTLVGNIPFEYGDYLLIPRGMIYQMHFDTEDNRLLIVESFTPIYTPKRYRNWFGQLMEHSPFCERDYKLPQEL